VSGTVAIIQARLGSTRLKGKMARRLGGQSMLERVVRRVTDAQLVDEVVVATGDGPEDERIVELVPPDVPVFVGSEHDVLARFAAAASAFNAKAVVRVCADNPFIDPGLIDHLVVTGEKLPVCDYASYRSRDGRPAVLSSLGMFAEWCRAEALHRANREATTALDREHVTRYLYAHPELFQLRLTPVPKPLDREDFRLTVDYEEDWENAQAIYEALGSEEFDWRRIAGLLDQQPGLLERMAQLNREHVKV